MGEFSANTPNTPVNGSLITGLSYPTGIAAWGECVPALGWTFSLVDAG